MSETGQARGNDICMVLCPEVIHVKWCWWSSESSPLLFSLLFASSPLILSFAPLVGLWLSSVPVVWHAAGDEGAVRRNSAQEVEHYLQVHINDKCKMLVFVLHNIPRKQVLPACWHLRCLTSCEGILQIACHADLPFSSHKAKRALQVVGPLHIHIHTRLGLWETSSSWFWSFTTSQREEVF